MTWEVEVTDQFSEWWDNLDQEEQEAITAAGNVLQRGGPSLGRPLVDTIKQSRHKNMKELTRPQVTSASSSRSIRAALRSC